MDAIRKVHAGDYIDFLTYTLQEWRKIPFSEHGLIPDTFPLRILGRRPENIVHQAGWYCFDTATPLVENTFSAALGSAYCALNGADLLLDGERCVYALCRPPGHHAGYDFYGGFCYFNNAALAAIRLLDSATKSQAPPKVAILDLDYHHGNGTQQIFYESDRVLYLSIHASPAFEYPLYWGFADETGAGKGIGYNLNIPLPEGTKESEYMEAVEHTVDRIVLFKANYLIISLGTDTSYDDQLGTFKLSTDSFAKIAHRIAAVELPTLVIQEGGYNTERIGHYVLHFLSEFHFAS